MTNEQLQRIIDQLDAEELKQTGIFGIHQYGGDADESFIRANREGLLLFALELLQSARDTETALSIGDKQIIPFNQEGAWVDEDSSTFIHYVEPVAGREQYAQPQQQAKTIGDRLAPYGCGLVAIILVIALITGIVTLIKWVV